MKRFFPLLSDFDIYCRFSSFYGLQDTDKENAKLYCERKL